MGYHQQGFGIFFQMFFQPVNGVVVDMVGRFIQNQKIHRRDQRRRQSHSFFLTAGKSFHLLFKIRDPQFSQDGLCFTFQRPCLCLIHFFCQVCSLFHQFFIFGRFRQSRHRFFIIPHQCQLGVFSTEYLLQHSCAIHKQRALGKISDTHAVHGDDGAAVCLIHPCDDFQQSGFACTIDTDHADLIPFMDTEGDIIEDDPCAVTFSDIFCCQ